MLVRLKPLIIACAVIMAVFWCIALPCVASFDYAEGDTATWVYLLRHGIAIYAQPVGLPLLNSNYPPLHLNLIAKLAPSDSSILITGRIVSLISMFGCIGVVFFTLHKTCRNLWAAALGAALFAATFRVGTSAAVCRADMPALFLGLCAGTLAAFRVRGWPIFSAVLFTISLFMKHSLIVIPVGIALWSLLYERRAALLFVPLLGLLVLTMLWKLHMVEPLFVWSIAPWRLATWRTGLVNYVLPSLVGAGLGLVAVRSVPSLPPETRKILLPWAVIFVVGLLWLVALGRAGATANHLLELLTAMVILVVTAAACGVYSRALERLLALHVLVTFIETLIGVAVICGWLIPRAKVEQAGAQRAISGIEGPVIAEEPWMTTSVGRPPVLIPFVSKQLGASGRWDPTPLESAIAQGQIAAVLLTFPLEEPVQGGGHDDRFLPSTLAALQKRYVRVERVGDLFVYRPR